MKININEKNISRIKKLQIKFKKKEKQKNIVYDKNNSSKKKDEYQKLCKCNIKYN